MTNRVVVDVTQLYSWTGKLTGIPRVMYELTTRLIEDPAYDVNTVVWDPALGYTYQVEWRASGEYKGGKTPPDDRAAEESSDEPMVRTYGLVHRIYRAAPSPIKRTANRVADSLKKRQSKPTVLPSPYVFQPDDTLIVVWGEWGDPGYRHYLQDITKNHHVGILQVAHDMIPLLCPQFSGHSTEALEKYVREVYPLCKAVLGVSQNTLHDVESWMNENKLSIPRLARLRLGDDFAAVGEEAPNHPYFEEKTSEPFAICLGTIEARKNHAILYYTYKLANSRGIELPDIAIVGRRGWMTENIYEFMTKDPDVRHKFIFVHDASDSQLAWIMKRAKFSIYPSFYEGWGLPIAESMVRGVPCITTRSSSLPEVAGDAALYFNPASSDECLSTIQDMMDDRIYATMKKRAEQYTMTSWDTTYAQLKEEINGQ